MWVLVRGYCTRMFSQFFAFVRASVGVSGTGPIGQAVQHESSDRALSARLAALMKAGGRELARKPRAAPMERSDCRPGSLEGALRGDVGCGSIEFAQASV